MKNFLTLIGANVPTAAVCTAKSPQNSGGGSSQSFTLRSIGAQYFTRFLGSSCRVWKYAACMLMVLFVGIGNVWGADFNCTDITTEGKTTDGITVKRIGLSTTAKAPCGGGSNVNSIAFNGNGDTGNNGAATNCIVVSSAKAITSLTVEARGNGSSTTGNMVLVFYSTESGGTTCSSYVYENGSIAYNGSGADCPASQTITPPSGTKRIEIYRRVNINGTTMFASGNSYRVGSATQFNVFSITVTAASSGPVDPTITFNNGNYTIDGAALDLSSLFTSNSKGTVTYSITNAGTTGATLAADGKSFSATAAGTATVQASQAAEEGKYKAKAVTATITVAACETSISAQPENASLKVGDANPTLSVTANNASAYAWKESSNGTDKDGAEVLGTGDTFTPSVNNAAQTKYYYCEVTSSCNGTTVVKSDIATVEVTLSVEPVVVYQHNFGGTDIGQSTFTGAQDNQSVKIKNVNTTGIKFGNSAKYENSAWDKIVKIEAAGDYAFLKGDKVYFTHAFNNEDAEKYAHVGIWEPTATAQSGYLATFETNNTNNTSADPATDSYTLTANAEFLMLGRVEANTSNFITALRVERPAIESATAVISAVKVNGTAISAANLATLLSEKSLTLSESASTTPTVNFYKTSTIKYVEDIEDGSYTKEIAATVTQPSNYKAVVTIDEVEYTINIPKAASTDATLSALTVGGEAVEGFAAATLVYNVELPFGTTAVPAVAATANDDNAKEVKVTQATALPGAATVVVKAEDNTTTKTYTINFTVADSKDIRMAWNTSNNFCSGAEKYSSAVKSDNALVSAYINKITFTNVEGSGDNGAEGGSLNVGKKTGNMFTLTAKAGYAIKAMQFAAKIQDATCEYSLNGGDWTTLSSTNTDGDACYTVFSDEEVHEFRLRSTGTSGVWIRNMELSIITACTPVKLTWTAEPAAEYEVGKAASAIAATANNGGAVAYSTTASGIVNVAANGALTIAGLGSVTLKAATAEGDGTAYCANGGEDIVISKAVNTYYLVKFNAQNETTVNEVKYYAGDVAIATPVQPSYSGFVFQGWFDAASAGNAVAFPLTPESSRTIYAQWVAECTGPTINVHPASANYLTGRTASALTCEATAGAAGELTYTWYSCDDAERTNPVALVGAPTPSTAVAGTFYYYCAVTEAGCDIIRNSNVATITIEDKEPVCIIKATPSSATEATADGAYKGSAAIKSSGKKLSSKYDYVAVQLMAGKSFLATDKVVLNQAADLGDASDITKFYIFTEVPADGKTYVTVDNASPVKGDNWFTMPAEMAGESSLYIGRVDAKCNPTVGYLAVYRVMNPELMAITINGRDGVADELVANKFNVTIPYEAVLANLSITKTVAWNAPHATTPATVISNGGAWVFGDNTYRVMDKDGDYTDYTITLTRDVLKYQVSFNTHGGSAVASVEVVHGEKLAAAPADPTKEDYIFQGWAETDGGAIVDVTTFTISANKEFHAVWVSDGAIKLLDGSTVNHTNFITGVTAAKVTISDVEYDYVTFAGGVGADVNNSNIKNLDRLVAYNATTTQTKVKLSLYNSNGSNKRTIYVKGLVEGADASTPLATIELDGGEKRTTEWLEFNNEANRTIYIFVSGNAGDIKILQEKVIESGSALKMAGEAGYSINLNQGRIFGASGATLPFEGMSYTLVGDYTTLSSSVVKLKSTSAVFDVTSPVTLQVTANDKTYYVTKGSAGTDNETAKSGVSEFDLTAGTWYITAGSSEVQISNIAFTLPKCAEPAFNALANSELCEGEAFEALDGTATVGDAGTPIYQWYNADGDEAIEGATSAKYTPTATGSYYVIATNQLAGYSDNSKKSTTVTVTRLASTVITAFVNARGDVGAEKTLSVTAEGANLHYAWYTCDDAEGTNPVAVEPANDAATYGVTITAATQYFKVVVSGECGSVEKILVAEKWVPVEQANVTGSRTWDWAAESMGEIATESGSVEYLMANVSSQIPNTEAFRSDMLYITANYANRGSSNKFFQGWQIRFYTEVPGKVSMNCRAIHGTMSVTINGTVIDDAKGSDMSTATTPFFVPAGWVTIAFDNQSSGYEGEAARIQKIVFNAEPDYTRNNVTAGNYLTICLPTAGVMTGASIYEIAYYEEASQKIFLDEVMNGVMVADRPYVFQATGSSIGVFYTEEEKVPVEAGNYKGLYGTYTELSTVTAGSSSPLWNKYIISGNQYIYVDANNCILPAYRAYIDMTHVEGYGNKHYAAPAPTPGRRRIAIGGKAPQIATGLEDAAANEKPVKVLINGEMFIIRGEKMYDATGRLVK